MNCAAAAALLALSTTPAFAQAQATTDAARQSLVIHQAVQKYEAQLAALDQAPPAPDQSPIGRQTQGGVKTMTLEDSVALALEKNLDIQVSRLEPQSVDMQVAGIRNTYRPVFASTVGQREQFQLPTLTGGNRVNQGTTTYNMSLTQEVPLFGGSYNFSWSNSRVVSSDALANYNPLFTTGMVASYTQPIIRGFKMDNQRQQLQISLINRDVSEESARATVAQTVANVRNAYWDLVFARSAVDVARRALELADKLVVDNQARVEVGTLAPLDIVQAQAEAATRRQTLAAAEATASTADLALKRFIVSGVEDPLWRQEIVPVDVPQLETPPMDVEAAVRRAIDQRTDIKISRKNLDTNEINMRYFKNESMPALDVTTSYGAQGLGGTFYQRQGSGIDSQIVGTTPGGYFDALNVLSARDYPNWNISATLSYPIMGNQAEAQYARSRIQRQQAQTRLQALEVQIAAEVANAAFTVQSNLRRVEAASVARELAEKRLEAEQSKFEVGMTTNFFVVQAQRDLRDAQNAELRALADYRKSLVNFERAQQAPAGGGGGGGNFAATGGQ
jgi:outer membrane protein TolC